MACIFAVAVKSLSRSRESGGKKKEVQSSKEIRH